MAGREGDEKMNTKTYSLCPTCGCNVPMHTGDEGTNSFESVDIQKLHAQLDRLSPIEIIHHVKVDGRTIYPSHKGKP